MNLIRVLTTLIVLSVLECTSVEYEPTWESLDARPLPAWFDEAKFGIFIVWGIYSVPSFYSEWFWYYWKTGTKEVVDFMEKNYPPDFTYADFAAKFTAEFYDPNQWADLFKAAGAKYIVFTTKHCEGFTLWNSSYSYSWNSVDVGPKRDLVGDLAKALRSRTDIRLGLYYALYEWYNPLCMADAASGFKTRDFVQMKTMPELYELVLNYKPDLIWSDADYGPDTYWNSTGFLAWLYNESPIKDTVIVNDRWGYGCGCKHGGYYNCPDRYNPKTLQKHKWENSMTIDVRSWGYRREATMASLLSIHDLITTLAETVSCGGNLLMDVGPTLDGRIIPIFEERLLQFGQWLKVNGEAIYASKPWNFQNDTVTEGVWYTKKDTSDGQTVVYAIVLEWPSTGSLLLGAPVPTTSTTVTMLGYNDANGAFTWSAGVEEMTIEFPPIPINKLPSTYAWVLKIENLKNSHSSNQIIQPFVRHVDFMNEQMPEKQVL